MPHPAVAVFTEKSLKAILAAGGSSAWVLNPKTALKHRYLACTRNQTRRNPEAMEPHKSAFLVGLIDDVVVTAPELAGPPRYLVRISDWAKVDVPHAWQDWRNPVRYATLEQLGIEPAALAFEPVQSSAPSLLQSIASGEPPMSVRALTIEEAKAGLAKGFGVSPNAIEITIRW